MSKNLLTFLIAVIFFIAYAQPAHAYEKLFYFRDIESSRKSLFQNINKIDILAPQVYGINSSLIPHGTLPPDIKNLALSHSVRVMPLITNDHFDQGIAHNLLASSTAQDQVIKFMLDEARNNSYYGWQFDIEHMKNSDRDLFSQFVEKTATALKQNHLVLSVAVTVRVDNSTTSDAFLNWSGIFDYPRIARAADFLSIMTYDDPNSVGPTASIPFVTKSLNTILATGVPPEKISLGIPSYYWSWTTFPTITKIRSGSYERLQSIRARTKYIEGFDNILGVPWLAFSEQGISYRVWHENQKSFQLKTDIVRNNRLKGFSMWVLGSEDPNMWNSV